MARVIVALMGGASPFGVLLLWWLLSLSLSLSLSLTCCVYIFLLHVYLVQ